MTTYCDNDTISQTLGIPVEIIEGILSGRISEEVLEDYNPAKPPEIKVVEQRKFVRSLIIGMVSFGSSGGSTLTSSLATLMALRNNAPIAAIDFNEFSALGSYLGIPLQESKLYPNLAGWTLADDLQQCLIKHPQVSNLEILLGSVTLENYLKISIEKMISALDILGNSHEAVWVDCPKSPHLWPSLFPRFDVICFVIQPNVNSISALLQAVSILEINPEKHFVIIKEAAGEGFLSITDCSRLIKDTTKLSVLGVVPESREVRRFSNLGENYIIKKPKSEYAGAIEQILLSLIPTNKQKRANKSPIFSKLFSWVGGA